MKLLALASCVLFTTAFAADTTNNPLSYAMGYKTGQALKTQSIALDTAVFSKGLSDGYQGIAPSVSENDMQTALTQMQTQVSNTMQQKFSQLAEKNLQDGKTFLAENAKKPGVVTTASGLQYQIITPGSGASPTTSNTVTVNYEGKLIDGTVFDSSYKRGQPATFKVGDVISGWQEALKLMKPGATWMLFIPANLAYGANGSPGAIGPNATLIFKVDLIKVA